MDAPQRPTLPTGLLCACAAGESGGDGEDALGLDCLFKDVPDSNKPCTTNPSPPTARPTRSNKFSIKRNMGRMKLWK